MTSAQQSCLQIDTTKGTSWLDLAKKMIQHAKITLHPTNFTMQRQLPVGEIWHSPQRSHEDLEHWLRWCRMVKSQSTGECRWLGDQQCSEAGTFCLFGLRRINIVTPESHPSVVDCKQSRHWCMWCLFIIDHLFRCTRMTGWSSAHTEMLTKHFNILIHRFSHNLWNVIQ